MSPRAVIFACQGPDLLDWERAFFADCDPLGFIVFARNCGNPEQLRALCDDLRASVGREAAPILIDQEGGRVVRLRPPHWRLPPAPGLFGALACQDRPGAVEAVRLNSALIAAELNDLGITVDCLPLLDLPTETASAVIGDRAFCGDIDTIVDLAQVQCDALLAGGVLPVIKHIPGHGRALVDSHHELPRVDASRRCLEESDFLPFRALGEAPWAMTGHVIYEAIDPERPATTSPRVIEEVIRDFIGFDGLLVSDDLSMAALEGRLGERAEAALAAGCDVALHCNGRPEEMEAVAEACDPLTAVAEIRVARGEAIRENNPAAFDRAAAQARLNELLAQSA